MQTHLQIKGKTKTKKKLYAIALSNDFSVIKKLYSAEEIYCCDFDYLAEFSYDKDNKVNKIEIYNIDNVLVCTITKYDIKNADLDYISRMPVSFWMQGIDYEEGMKSLFFKQCLCSK